jgi:hypothetical protein
LIEVIVDVVDHWIQMDEEMILFLLIVVTQLTVLV